VGAVALSGQQAPWTVADSAGILIVTNHRFAGEEEPGWTVEDPILRIGEVEGEPAYLFGDVADVLWHPNGCVFVADEQAQEVRVFTREGAHVRTVGKRGDGPGEFRDLSYMSLGPGDSVVVWDGRLSRITMLTAEGAVARTATVRWELYNSLHGLHRVADDLYAMTSSLTSFDIEETPGLLVRPEKPIYLINSRGEISQLGTFPTFEVESHLEDGTFTWGSAPFGRSISVAAGAGNVYVGTQEQLEYRVYTPERRLVRIVRGPPQDLRVGDELKARYWEFHENRILETPRQRREFADEVANTRFPASRAAFTRLLVDAELNVWLKEGASGEDLRPRSWFVFSPEGVLLGRVAMPERFVAIEIGSDYVLGVWRDELRVPYVEIRRLVKP